MASCIDVGILILDQSPFIYVKLDDNIILIYVIFWLLSSYTHIHAYAHTHTHIHTHIHTYITGHG